MKAIELQLQNYKQLSLQELEMILEIYDYQTKTQMMNKTEELELLRIKAEMYLRYQRSYALLTAQSISNNLQEVIPMLVKFNHCEDSQFVLGDNKLYGISELPVGFMVAQLGSVEERGAGLYSYSTQGHFEDKYLFDSKENVTKFLEVFGYKMVEMAQAISN